ncbi:MAG: BMC domain-containing protein [Lachnospiraceae bacterium]
MKALGLIELPNLADAIEAVDVMLKTADVKFLTWEKKLGGRLVTIIVQGAVSSVTEAVESAKSSAKGNIVASAVIANPHEETMKLVARSAAKYRFHEEIPIAPW